MRVEKDYEEFLGLLNRNKVRYCVVGAYAVAFYSTPRYTKDLDILIEPTTENAKRFIRVLNKFGFKSLRISEKDLTKKGNIVQLGYEPLRIDVLTSIQGVGFDQIWRKRKLGRYGRHKVIFIGRDELVKNKRASGRIQDKVDLEALSRTKRKKKP